MLVIRNMKNILAAIITLSFGLLQAQNPQEGWAFKFKEDPFTTDTVLGLRHINEDVAGENGFVRR